jgi:hypothetical protein
MVDEHDVREIALSLPDVTESVGIRTPHQAHEGGSMTEPAFGHGKICCLQMPAVDIQQSAGFYRQVFGWNVRERGDGEVAFDDGVGEVSGTWKTHLKKGVMR